MRVRFDYAMAFACQFTFAIDTTVSFVADAMPLLPFSPQPYHAAALPPPRCHCLCRHFRAAAAAPVFCQQRAECRSADMRAAPHILLRGAIAAAFSMSPSR
jgi:hypothetical protein